MWRGIGLAQSVGSPHLGQASATFASGWRSRQPQRQARQRCS
jgi:hypothetical protein